MLGKLLKYEIKSTARLFLPLYLTIVVFAAINLFLLPENNISIHSSTLYDITLVVSMIIYVTLMVGLLLMTLIVMVQRFYKNLLGDEGYLMFTLPVQSHEHIFSKLGVSMLWTVISGFVAAGSILIVSSKSFSAPEILKEIAKAFGKFMQYFGASAPLVSLEIIVVGLLSLASTILTIYAAIALGHLFNKHKLLISFGMYIALKTVSQILGVLFFSNITKYTLFGPESNMIPNASQINSTLLLTIIYFGIITVGYFILANYILKRKLNLE